jgi:hypothetical protein
MTNLTCEGVSKTGRTMEDNRETRQALEQRLTRRLDDVDRLWHDAQRQSGLGAEQYGPLAARIGRRLTWKLWNIAMQEALAVIDGLPLAQPNDQDPAAARLCHLCKRRLIALVPDADLEDLLDTA